MRVEVKEKQIVQGMYSFFPQGETEVFVSLPPHRIFPPSLTEDSKIFHMHGTLHEWSMRISMLNSWQWRVHNMKLQSSEAVHFEKHE